MTSDLRLIEDYIPIEAISEESRRAKSIRKGHLDAAPLVAAGGAEATALRTVTGNLRALVEAGRGGWCNHQEAILGR